MPHYMIVPTPSRKPEGHFKSFVVSTGDKQKIFGYIKNIIRLRIRAIQRMYISYGKGSWQCIVELDEYWDEGLLRVFFPDLDYTYVPRRILDFWEDEGREVYIYGRNIRFIGLNLADLEDIKF